MCDAVFVRVAVFVAVLDLVAVFVAVFVAVIDLVGVFVACNGRGRRTSDVRCGTVPRSASTRAGGTAIAAPPPPGPSPLGLSSPSPSWTA